jgi:hypothetical protein
LTDVSRSSLASFFGTNSTNLRDNGNQNCLVYNSADGLVFQGIATIPLAELHNFFAEMPSVASSSGFELRIQSNLSRENSYVTRYPAIPINSAANGAGLVPIIPDLVTSQQIVGHACCFLLSNPSGGTTGATATCGSSGLAINNTTAINAGATISVKACIGWNNQTGQLTNFQGTSANPCRIYLPSVNFNNNYIKQIIQQPQYSLKYLDYYVDIDEGKVQGSSVSRLFNVQLSRVRTLSIIPFLSGGGVFPSPFNSPISSAPITCSPCRLRNFNIQIGGSNIFSEPLNFNQQFYMHNNLNIMANVNGNSLKSRFFSGQISKSMFENGYNVYSIDLQKVQDELQDSMMKSFQLIYQIEDNSSVTKLKYDLYYIITYQSELSLDRSTGSITNNV